MRIRPSFALLALAACGPTPPPQTAPSPPPGHGVQTAPAPAPAIDAGVPDARPPAPPPADAATETEVAADPDRPCIADEKAKAACEARGAGFSYGPAPWIYCRGIPPRPGERARFHEIARNSACRCNDLAAIQKRRRQCARVP